MIRVACNGKVMALAFSHPSYEANHKESTVIIEGGKVTFDKTEVPRQSRKTVAILYDVTDGQFIERARAEAKVHHTDQFIRSQGRLIALKRLTASPLFTKDEKRAIWAAHEDRRNATHISPPKPPTGGTILPFTGGAPTPLQMLGNTHTVASYVM